jgi:hypothetical protein
VRLRADAPHSHWRTHTVVAGLAVDAFRATAVFDGLIDNLTMHEQPEVQAAIERVGARIRFLPPYSPDFNPSEQAFAKLKIFLRAAGARSFDQVVELVAIALELFSSTECLNFVRHCGYRVSTTL